MSSVRILDLDGSLAPQADLFTPVGAVWLPAQDWGLRVRLACGFGTFDRFRRWLSASLPNGDPAVTLYGSGDFHHISLALLAQIRGRFNLLVLDKHPDWMRGMPFLHCGTWLRHALRLPGLCRVFLCGGEADFDNAYRWLAPWPEIRAGRVLVFPARRRFVRGEWARVKVHPLLADGASPAETLQDAVEPFRQELGRYPLYVSIDKDVLTAEDAAVNWDSGLLRLPEAVTAAQTFLAAAQGRLAGADLLGDWSPVRLGHSLSRLCDRLDHASPLFDPRDAAERNRRANAALLRVLLTGSGAAR
jgi:hypothetical protein